MSILFDSDYGFSKQEIQQIIDMKREYLRDTYGIVINDDPSSIYNIIAISLSLKEYELMN
ncbi:Hypothetical protein BCO_0008302 (plasmid) [Borrelia coriaceae ATCC 43381]|uniref:Uncharacterized protein n=1 Tax=Borrelia coriaceae ATCC 43381 TaxID=1408429 RepID=W5SX92_9SPIR|nr:Hypothetical protein BCO_0008302 [Borrelia coriaceae ATCC 43381]